MSFGRERVHNRLLALLPAEEYARLAPALEPVSMTIRQTVYEPYRPMPHVYFPTTSLMVLVTLMEDGSGVSVATVGNEGMVGISVFLGVESSPGRAFTHLPGAAVRLRTDVFIAEVARSAALRSLLQRYLLGLFTQLARSAACSRRHPIDQRCARWLLALQDAAAANEFVLTQEFFAELLGVRRASVTEAVGRLQRAGVIHFHYGRMTIVDRPGLEAASCSCYSTLNADFDRLLG